MAFLLFICIIFSAIHCSLSADDYVYKDYANYSFYRIEGDQSQMKYLSKTLKDQLHEHQLLHFIHKNHAEILVPPNLKTLLHLIIIRKNLKMKIIYNDISEIIREEKQAKLRYRNGLSWTAYYDVDDIHRYLKNMSSTYPQWTETIVGGKSYEGRQILGLRINTPGQDNYTENKPVFFIESGIHAREWIAPAVTTYFINQLLTSSDPKILALRDQFDWRIFPTVNPDGYHYSYVYDRYWRKTRSRSSNGCRGADPNRNWDYNWGQHSTSKDPCDYQLYAGSAPFSEVETRTLAAYISKIDNLLFYVAFHSYASLLLVPYSDSTEHVDNYEDLVQVGKTSLEYGSAVNGNKYDGPGTAAETLYRASGGSMDWVRFKHKTRLVYTYELRGSSFHWPPSRIPEQGDEVTQMMLGLATEARNMGYY
ncbi:zinc carboxypeptidase-like [Epargyreus clarus]|uniref:zinc carboxypeptidase-like n=1 Tax=Epargyreus clarus TaxID=520877 RepID=UPI003C2CA22D